MLRLLRSDRRSDGSELYLFLSLSNPFQCRICYGIVGMKNGQILCWKAAKRTFKFTGALFSGFSNIQCVFTWGLVWVSLQWVLYKPVAIPECDRQTSTQRFLLGSPSWIKTHDGSVVTSWWCCGFKQHILTLYQYTRGREGLKDKDFIIICTEVIAKPELVW